jgi:hypothetical protein
LGYKTIGGRSYGAVFGATLAGHIWQLTMNAALQGVPVEQFTGPSSYYEIGITTAVPNVAGQSPGNAMAALTQAGFHPQIVAGTVPSTEKLGTVARTSPPAGATASTGAVIKIYISDGRPPPPKGSQSPVPSNGPSPPPSSPPASPPASPSKPPKHPRHHHP